MNENGNVCCFLLLVLGFVCCRSLLFAALRCSFFENQWKPGLIMHLIAIGCDEFMDQMFLKLLKIQSLQFLLCLNKGKNEISKIHS